jgi:putative transposase
MARLARIVLPRLTHHVTQRGNGRARTFFSDDDYAFYRDLLRRQCTEHEVAVWGWCLMPNHVHLVLAPSDGDGLRRALARVHRHYAGHVHAREQRTGHFWQGRFGCVAMDEAHAVAALAYVALNPVRARLAARAADWPWSSARAFAEPGRGDGLSDMDAVADLIPAVNELIAASEAGADGDARFAALRRGESVGRPVGGEAFMNLAETQAGRTLKPRRPGRKPKTDTAAAEK